MTGDGKNAVWKSVMAAVRTMWEKEHIAELTSRLADYRSQLTLSILLILNKHSVQQKDGLSSLRDEIVEVVALSCQDKGPTSNTRPSETIAAILTNRDGASRAITNQEPDPSFKTRLAHGEARTVAITYSQEDQSDGLDHLSPTSFKMVENVADYKKNVLDALHFRGVTDRYFTIPEAHRKSFEWAWEFPVAGHTTARCDNLALWLKSDTKYVGNCYWLSGKAGSGKSSLMKYLRQDPRTTAHLQAWAGDANLVVSDFYFWYAGTPLHKSQLGLLRSLLLSILSQRPELTTVLFPDTCRALISGKTPGRIDMSLTELKTAFATLIRCVPNDLRICLMVDGIDEYAGDYNELCDLLSEVSEGTSIKILLSSRPIPTCIYRFEQYPQLRLQDLTRDDIRRYVLDTLGNHSIMKRMERVKPGVTSKLVNKVTAQACGVFLWVKIVVMNVDLGLQNYNTITDLMEEIEKLPPDLEKLYDHMLGGIDARSRVLGSKFLQLVFRSVEICPSSFPLTLLQLSFAEEDNYKKSLDTPVEALSSEERNWRAEATEGRLRSRCCGLIEVQDPFSEAEYSRGGHTVGFLHRTVMEFLQSDVIWSKLTLLTSQSDFSVDLALMSSSVLELKAMPVQKPASPSSLCASFRMARMLGYERHLSGEAKDAFHSLYLPEMRSAIGYHWHDATLFNSPAEEVAAVNESYTRCSVRLNPGFPYSTMLSLSIRTADPNIILILNQVLTLNEGYKTLLSAYFLISFVEEQRRSLRLSMARNFGNLLTDPNEPLSIPGEARNLWNDRWNFAIHERSDRDWSLWEFMLHHCFSIMINSEDAGFDFTDLKMVLSLLEILLTILKGGADVKTVIVVGKILKEAREMSAMSVILSLLSKIWSLMLKNPLDKLDDLAEQACLIEQSLNEKGGFIVDNRLTYVLESVSESLAEPQDSRKRWTKGQRMGKSYFSKADNATGTSKTSVRKIHRQPWSSGVVREPQSPSQSPWFQHKHRYEKVLSQEMSGKSETTTERSVASKIEWQKQWQLTHRSRRVELLSEEQQRLVAELAKPDQTSRDKRRTLLQLSTLPYERQKEVLDCSEVMKSAQSQVGVSDSS